MGIVGRLIRCLPSHPYPPNLKEEPQVLPQVTGVPVHLSSFRTGHSPTGLYNACKGSETDGPHKGNQASPVPGRLADQGPVSGRSPSEQSDSGRTYTVLRVDNKSGEIRTKTCSSVFVLGLRIPSRFSYTLPFWIRPSLTRSPNVISCYVNPHRKLCLLEALHQLIEKNTVELVNNQRSLGFFNGLFLVPKPNNMARPILDLSNLNQFFKVQKFKMGTPETIRTSLQQGEWVTSIDFKDACFHIPIQE